MMQALNFNPFTKFLKILVIYITLTNTYFMPYYQNKLEPMFHCGPGAFSYQKTSCSPCRLWLHPTWKLPGILLGICSYFSVPYELRYAC